MHRALNIHLQSTSLVGRICSLFFAKLYRMKRNKSSRLFFSTFVLITVFSVVSCKDSSDQTSCYDALIEAGVSDYRAELHCYGPRS